MTAKNHQMIFLLFITRLINLFSSFPLQIGSDVCPFDHYNTLYLNSSNFSSINCAQKILNPTPISRIVLIIPNNYSANVSDPVFSVFSIIYNNLSLGLANESFELSKYSNPSPNLTVLILSYEYNLTSMFPRNYFRRIKSSITIQTLDCSILNILGCANLGQMPGRICFQSMDYIIYVSGIMNIFNVVFDGSQSKAIQGDYSSDSALLHIESVLDDPSHPVPSLKIKNLIIESFNSMGPLDQKGSGYFILNSYYCANVFVNNIIFDASYFPLGIIAFYTSCNSEPNNPITNLNISSAIIQNQQNNANSPFIMASGSNLIVLLTNLTVKDFSATANPFYLFTFLSLDQTVLMNSINFLNLNGQTLFLLDSCALNISSFQISNSLFGSFPIYISNKNTFLSIYNMKTTSCRLNNSASYFLVNQRGILFLSNFLFDNATYFQLWLVGSNSFISSGIFSNIVAKRILILDTSTFSLRNISFYSANVNNSLILFYTISAVFIDSLQFFNATSLSCIFEAQNVNSIEIINTNFTDINTSYFLSPMALALLKFTNYSLSWLSCYRGFYVTVSLKVLFTNVYFGHFTLISGPYFFQFMKISGEMYSVVFEEIYGYKSPYAMFHLSGGTVRLTNCTLFNVGWKNNDTTAFFSIDDNAIFYFFNEKSVLIENCVMVSSNLSLHTGFLIYTGGAGNLTIVNSIFKHANHPELFAMGLVMMGATNLVLTNNTFIGLICPNSSFQFSRFQHINGPVAILGEAVYAPKKNARIANISNNQFYNCSCKVGGSLCIINYNQVYIQNLKFHNSSALQKGGSFAIISVSQISFVNVSTDTSQSLFGAVGMFINIDKLTLINTIFQNSVGKFSGCFQARNTHKIIISNCSLDNATSNGNGAFLIMIGFSVEVYGLFSNNTNSMQGGLFYLAEGVDFLIMDSVMINSFASESGGFLSVDLGKNITLKNLILIGVSSKGEGGALTVKGLESFYLEKVDVTSSVTGLTGVLYFKCSNQSSIHRINDLKCLLNQADQGSCIYFDSESPLIINNTNMTLCIGMPLFFSSALKANIIIENALFFKNQFKDKLMSIENVIISIDNAIFWENVALVSENAQAFILSIGNVEDFRINRVSIKLDEDYMQIKKLVGFKVLSSNIQIGSINVNFNNIVSFSMMEASSCSIILTSATIKNIYHSEFSNGMIYLEDSWINVTSSNFINNLGPIFYVLNSNISVSITILNLTQKENIGSSNEFYIENGNDPSYLVLSQVQIYGFNGTSITIFSCSEVLLYLSNFVNIFPEIEFQAFDLKEISFMTVDSTYFSGFMSSSFGGAIYLINSITTATILVNSSGFSDNNGLIGGSIYIMSDFNITFLNSNFSNNSASSRKGSYSGVAGAIYLQTSQSLKSNAFLKNNNFTNNTADEAILDIFSSICLSLINNSFSQSTTNSNIKFLSFPLSINLIDSNTTFTIKPGNFFKINFEIIDCHNQIVNFDSNSLGNLNAKPLDNSHFLTLKSGSIRAAHGILTFSNVQVNIEPGSSFIMSISLNLYNILIKTSQKLQNSFIFPTINCSDGEILLIDKSCYACPNGSYSSNDFPNEIPNICLPCPENAQCQRNLIIPDPGYWRGIRESTLIVHCLIPDACTGEYVMNANGSYTKCLQYHQDNLCDVCEYGYGKYTAFSTCQECKDLGASQIGRAVAVLVVALIYIFHNSKSMIKSDKDSMGDVVAKILINHVQRVSTIMISEMQISLDALKPYANYFNYLSILTEDIFSNDCFLQMLFNDISKYPFYKILMTLMLPIIIACVCFLIFSVLILKKSVTKHKTSEDEKSKYFHKFIIFFLICAFLCYSMLIKSSINLLNCIPITNDPQTRSQSFLYNAPSFECWVGWHRFGAAPSGIAGIIIWGFFFPLFLWKIIKIKVAHTLKTNVLVMYNPSKNYSSEGLDKKTSSFRKRNDLSNDNDFLFFIKDYKPEFYYWESIVFFHKLLLNIFSQMNQWSNEKYLRMSNVIFLLIYFSIIHKLRPFAIHKINSLEFMSLITAVVTNVSTITVSSANISDALKYFLYFISIFLNVLFVAMGIYLIIRHTKWREMYSKTKSNMLSMRKRMMSLRGKTSLKKANIKSNKDKETDNHVLNNSLTFSNMSKEKETENHVMKNNLVFSSMSSGIKD